ncbi:iron ABC transporter permease [Rhodococcus sp. 06-156-3C]|uniref:ABC transporter permease n=1 Tax=Nocardiaceae TaxID=85025 RepID=UPI0009B90973|nr:MULTISPECIES: iron ABC transporter permease [Rhodococcus]OZD11383.1 iron ABC transporter permease [Rhodococcus sp. 06-156-3C]OZD13619.1 iron ABC transporter permease [Rhodococcus sp. 06-156-4a]OZD22041.1 iron ABC transporter permease [Rhodococcus sp. 06-156-4C]OZD30242.1 iron ABC transporter permease [Rhodococcus sp. 06-156-3]OZD37649.1 iron ABC transporter permease [Rhodococcus sp. 06-156-3b]
MATLTAPAGTDTTPATGPSSSFTIPPHWRARIGYAALLAILGYLVVLPMIRLQMLALEDGAAGYSSQYGRFDVAVTLRTTIALALGSLVIAMVLGTLLAFAASRLPAKLGWLRIIPILPIVMPAVASIVGWAFLLSPGPGYLNVLLRKLPWWSGSDTGPIDVYTVPWIIILTGFGLTSFVYLFVSSGMQNISSEHLEAAQISGSNTVGIFFKIVLPLLRPSLIYGGGIALLLGLGQFTGPLLLGQNSGVKVLTTEMYRRVSESPSDFAAAAAAGSPLVIFGIVLVLTQKVLLGNQTRFVTHGGKAFSTPSGRGTWAAVTIGLFALLALVIPLVGLVIVSLTPYWSGSLSWGLLTLDNFRELLGDSAVLQSVLTSVSTSLGAVAICIPLGYVMANLLVRGRRFKILALIADLITALPLGIPAVIFGVGFLLTYTEPPLILYGTRTVIILVYVVLMLPFATRMQMTAMLSLGNTYTEASATSGASPFVTTLRIMLPLMRPTILSAVALMFILLTHEFAASLLVRASTTQVMGTLLFDMWQNGSYPLVAAMALLMTAVTTIGVAFAMAVGGRNVLSKL